MQLQLYTFLVVSWSPLRTELENTDNKKAVVMTLKAWFDFIFLNFFDWKKKMQFPQNCSCRTANIWKELIKKTWMVLGVGGWEGGCASGRKCAKWDFHFIKRLLERLTALQRDKRRTWGTGKREERLPSRTDLTPTPRPNPSLYKIQKRRDEIRNPSLA